MATTASPTTLTRKARAKADNAATSTPIARPSKLDQLGALLTRPGGATLAQMTEATGWQVHSVRGAMAGSLKKGRGLTIGSDKVDGVRTYRATVTP